MKEIFLNKQLIEEVSVSEIDFDLNDDFSIDTDNEYLQLVPDTSEQFPIEIDRLINILQDLKNKGANYVELDYHCDHIGYDISGYKIFQ